MLTDVRAAFESDHRRWAASRGDSGQTVGDIVCALWFLPPNGTLRIRDCHRHHGTVPRR